MKIAECPHCLSNYFREYADAKVEGNKVIRYMQCRTCNKYLIFEGLIQGYCVLKDLKQERGE